MIYAGNAIATIPPPVAGATAPATDSVFSFDDLLDIVNPLQHIPVISTLYRAITGDQIKTFPKIAGDTLYGGVLGFAGSMADTIFQKITGKDFGDTVLAEVEDIFSPSAAPPTAVASASPPAATAAPMPLGPTAPALPSPATVAPAALSAIVIPGQGALLNALAGKGISPDTAARAADAYRRSLTATTGDP
jgi:hypothetical protein